jgi:hypothetical protein
LGNFPHPFISPFPELAWQQECSVLFVGDAAAEIFSDNPDDA